MCKPINMAFGPGVRMVESCFPYIQNSFVWGDFPRFTQQSNVKMGERLKPGLDDSITSKPSCWSVFSLAGRFSRCG